MSNILWTKVKFCRNLKGVMFSGKITSESQEDVLKLGLDACSSCGLKGESIEALSDKVINNLIASGKLENDFASSLVNKGYASNDETNVKINGKNHIEIMAKDLNLYDAYSKAKKIDKQLCNKLHFAYSDKYGFLGPDIKNIGSGMQISAMVMLPALTKLNAVRDLPKSNDKLIFNIKPIDLQSGIYLITTGATLGYGEKQICELTSAYINNVVKCEIEMCKNLAKDELEVLDKCLRAKAIINSCMKINIDELNNLIGDILIAINCGLEKDATSEQIIKLINCTKDVKASDNEYLAKIIKKYFK